MRNGTDIIYSVTAFYIERRTIISVAHAFDWPRDFGHWILSKFTGQRRCDPRGAIFVPAMEDENDRHG